MNRKINDRSMAGNLAGFFYYYSEDYPKDHWKPYFDLPNASANYYLVSGKPYPKKRK